MIYLCIRLAPRCTQVCVVSYLKSDQTSRRVHITSRARPAMEEICHKMLRLVTMSSPEIVGPLSFFSHLSESIDKRRP